MASKSLNTTLNWLLDRHLECIICKEKYNEPKALNCMHSFCQGCLLDYYKDEKMKPCPVCQKPTQLPKEGVRGLKGNFFLNSLLDDFSTLKIVDSSSDKQSEDGVKCEKHRECLKLLYCVPCKKLICRECAVIDHPETEGHRNLDCKDAALELRKSLQDVFPDYRRDIKACEESLQASSKAKSDFEESVSIAVSAVHAKAVEVSAQVKREKERMINDIETLERDRNTRFDEHEETVTKMLQEKQYTLEVAEDVVKNCSDSTFLDIYPDMASLASGQPVPQIDRCLSQLTFEQSTTSDVDLGGLDKEGKLKPFSEGKLKPFSEGKLKPFSEGKWELCNQFKHFQIVTSIAAVAHSDELALIVYRPTQQRAMIINDTTGKVVNTIKVQTGAYSIAEIQDKFVVLDTETDRAKVYNRDGTQAFDFGTVPEYLHGQDIPVYLRSVAVRKTGTVIVGDLKNASISEHLPDGSILSHIFLKNNIQPYSLALDSKDRIVVGDHGHQVVVVDDNGDPLITIEPTIDGHKVKCLGMCCDGSGIYINMNIMISNEDHCHVHHYDTEGRFINCIVKRLGLYSTGIRFTSDGQRLAVADAVSVKIYHKV